MVISTLATLALTCTTVLNVQGGDPHSREHVTRIRVDYQTRQALVQEYSFEAFQVWGGQDVESLLIDENLSSKPFVLDAESNTANLDADDYDSIDLSFDDSVASRSWSRLTIKRDGTARNEQVVGNRTFTESMTCKFN